MHFAGCNTSTSVVPAPDGLDLDATPRFHTTATREFQDGSAWAKNGVLYSRGASLARSSVHARQSHGIHPEI
jgi:hypothetical protein